MAPTIRRTLVALAAAGLLALPACGDDEEASTGGTTTEGPTGTDDGPGPSGPEVDHAFCDAVFAADIAIHDGDAFETGAAFAALEAAAPDELADTVAVLMDEAGAPAEDDADEHDDEESMGAGGGNLKRGRHEDPGAEGMRSEEFMAAYAEVESWVSEQCDVATLEVTGEDYSFEGLAEEVAAGPTVIHFDNVGDELHEIEILRINDGVTTPVDQIVAMEEDEALTQVTDVAGVHVSPGDDGWTTVDLAPGNYVALCFVAKGRRAWRTWRTWCSSGPTRMPSLITRWG